MRNEKNLIPNSERTPEERRRNAAKAGRASGEARRAKKTLRGNMELILSLPVRDGRKKEKLEELGIGGDDMSNAMVIAAALFQKAAGGDVGAVKELRDLVGETLPSAAPECEDDPITAALKEDAKNGLL